MGADHDGLIRWMADLNTRTLPENPFMLFGQMTTADPTRSAAGTESAWAYTHLPCGLADDESAELLAERVDHVLEQHAPGFTDHVVGKTTQRPSDLEASDANLHTGAVNGGTSQLFQQLIFRPAPGFGRAEHRCRTSSSAVRAPPRWRCARRVRAQRRAGRVGGRRSDRLAAAASQPRSVAASRPLSPAPFS